MKFLLDIDKCGFLMIAGTSWVAGDPGPKEIDLDQLNKSELDQLLHSCQRGFLKVEDPARFLAIAQQEARPEVVPPAPVSKPLDPEVALKTNKDKLSSVLKQRVPSIKKLLPSFSMGQLKKLEELEKKGKARKGLLKEVSALLAKHAKDVSKHIDVGDGQERFLVGVDGINSPNVTDIVESDIEEIVFNPTEE